MTETVTNHLDQPVGPDLGGWTSPPAPPGTPLAGLVVRAELLEQAHADGLFEVYRDTPESLWTYLPWGPITETQQVTEIVEDLNGRPDALPYVVLVDDVVVGFLCYLRISASAGSIEVGGVVFSPKMQRTRASTEVQYLLMKHAFELGYRRYEWKCDSLNAPSRATAARLGFSYEGTFKKATHYKGRSRDTAWFSITDDEWPAIDEAFQAWLDPSNFDSEGQQRSSLQTPKSRS